MSFFSSTELHPVIVNRRAILGGTAMLSGAAIALLAGRDALAAASSRGTRSGANDVGILNTALGAEHEAVAAYQLAADSGLLDKPTLALARQFQGHHRAHVDLLAGTVTKLGGGAVAPKKQYVFPTEKLKSQADVLRFAAQLEKGAVSAYLNAVPVFGSGDLAKAAASILGDEAMHWAVLRHAVGEDPVPVAFVS